MSLHKSLKPRDALVRRRNVLTRSERILRLKEQERWRDDSSVFGLPKVKPHVVEARSARGKAKEAEEGAEQAEAPKGKSAEE